MRGGSHRTHQPGRHRIVVRKHPIALLDGHGRYAVQLSESRRSRQRFDVSAVVLEPGQPCLGVARRSRRRLGRAGPGHLEELLGVEDVDEAPRQRVRLPHVEVSA